MTNENFIHYLDDIIDIIRTPLTNNSLSKKKEVSCETSYEMTLGFLLRAKEKFKELPDQDTFHSWVTIKREEDDECYTIVGEARHICYLACKCEIWSDCCGEHVDSLYIDGHKCYPPTWEPDMVRRVIDSVTGEVLYENQFPEWEH